MARTQSDFWGYLQSADSSRTDGGLYSTKVPQIYWAEDFAITKNDAGTVELTNRTSPINQPETIRFQIRDVANVYAGSRVDPEYYSPVKSGRQFVCSIMDTAKATDATGKTVLLPCKAHFVMQLPNSDVYSSARLKELLHRMFALAFDAATKDEANRLLELSRGAMNPKESYVTPTDSTNA